MVSIAKKSKDADHVVNQFVKNIYESTAEVSAGQGKALAVGTTQIQRQVDTVTNSLHETQERLANMAVVVNVSCLQFPIPLSLLIMSSESCSDGSIDERAPECFGYCEFESLLLERQS